jgi:energy-converting hydrogenase Eha subunit A
MPEQKDPRPRPLRASGSLSIVLPTPVMTALIRLAVQQDRDVVGQARRLITDGLMRAGLISEETQP